VTHRELAPGTVVYEEGAPADRVFLIEHGEVEVLKRVGDQLFLLGILGSGKIFGETGIILGRTHGTTVRALGPVRLQEMSRERFLAAFPQDHPFVLPLLRMLCERLADADLALSGRLGTTREAVVADVARVRLFAASDFVRRQIGYTELVIAQTPFRVGRSTPASGPPGVGRDHLWLIEHPPYRLSPVHFVIDERSGRLSTIDQDSELGTEVNGRRIGRRADFGEAALQFGDNQIVAGPDSSPIRFLAVIERKTPPATG
jgi:hypothetical protein